MSEVLNEIRIRVGEENLSTLRSRSGCGVNMTDAPCPSSCDRCRPCVPSTRNDGGNDATMLFSSATLLTTASSQFRLNSRAVMSKHQRSLNSYRKVRTSLNVSHRRLPKPYVSRVCSTKEFTRENFSSFKGLVCVFAGKVNRLRQRAAIVL